MSDIRAVARAFWAIPNKDYTALFSLLDTGLSVNAVNLMGISLLHLAAERGSPALVAELIRRGADVNSLSGYGITPLMMAAQAGIEENVTLLLASGADPTRRVFLVAEAHHYQEKSAFDLAANARIRDALSKNRTLERKQS